MIKRILLAIALLYSVSNSIAGGGPGDAKREFLIEISNIEMKSCDEFIAAISALDGVELVGYCYDMKVFCIKLDMRKHIDNSKIEDFFKAKENRKYSYFIKESGTIQDVMNNCSSYVKNRDNSH